MKEMVGGCCVCSDERGWPDNPLVYCDGASCTVAVHQACYGIVTVPTGPWFCRKCESPDRQARVRCELCPSRAGALKRSDSGGWAHVVCALYIPEVRFGNVTSMEPIILQLIPSERFNRTCYICHETGKNNRANAGACMQCNKTGCKQQFHVTCAQSLGLLCEEAGNYLDNVKYCGYCRHHYGKLKKGGNVKTIPPYKPISQDSPSSDSSPEKDLDTSPSGAAGPSAPEAAVATVSPQATTSKGSAKASTPGRKASTQSTSGEVGRASSASARLVTAKSQSASSLETPSTSAAYSKPSPHGSKAIPHSTPSTSRASGSETPSTSAAYSKQSPHASKAIQPKPSTSQGKSDKAMRKKSPSPGESLRKGSGSGSGPSPGPGPGPGSGPSPSPGPGPGPGPGAGPNPGPAPGGDGVPISIGTPAVSPHTQAKGPAPAASVNKLNQDPIVVINELPISTTTTSGTTIITTALLEQIGAMKFTNSNFTETVITQSDSVFGLGLGPDPAKQTKKRKAVSAAAAAASTSSYSTPIPTARPQKLSSTGVITAPREARAPVVERGQESARDDRPKKMKMDLAPPPPPPPKPSSSGGLNIQMEPNLSSLQTAHTAHYSASGSITISSSLAQAPQENLYSMSSSSSSLEMIPIHPQTSNTHVQNMSQKYPNIAQGRTDEPPASIVVSVPLPQGPVIQLTGHQNPIPDVMFIPPQSPGPSTSSWTLKHTMNMQTEDLTIEEVMGPARMRMETPDSMRAHQSGMSMERPNMSPDEPRNRKRGPPAGGGGSLNNMIPHKKKKDPPPRSDTRPEPQEQYYSPPSSPDARTARNIKSAIEKMARAPHMLGNELNPESAAAARLSEHLNAELVAHSVFRAPSPLVPPPLINRATSSRNLAAAQGGPGPSGLAGLGALGALGALGGPSSSSMAAHCAVAPVEAVGTAPLGLGGNPQSLDQLLERQWEQGSQFLMEQAQHFDIASLLSCLHQLRTENVRLQDYIGNLSQRRDHLLAVNARLAIPLNVETPANSTFASSSRSVTPANVEVAIPMDMPRGQRDNNGNQMRPNPIRGDPSRAGPVEHQHMVNRDLQPKSS